MKKSTKRIVLSTERKNDKGFHVATDGIDLTQYNRNPILLWMHKRPKGERTDEILPLGNGVDLEVKDGQLSFIPLFDDTDEYAMKIYHKVENGTIRMASAGLAPKEWEKRGTEPWLKRSTLVEITLCDIGSNSDALPVELYNKDKIIELSANYLDTIIPKSKTEPDMKIELNAEKALPLVNLTKEATGDQFLEEVEKTMNLVKTQADEIVQLKKDKADAQAAEQKAKGDLEKFQNEAGKSEIVQLVAGAKAKGKITADQEYLILGSEEKGVKPMDVEHAKAWLESLPENPTIEQQLKEGKEGADSFLKLVADKSWKELDADEMLIELREKHLEVFKQKYKAHFKKDYVE